MFSNLENKLSTTIYANASPNQKCGLIVIRVSGPEVQYVIKELGCRPLSPRHATLAKIYHPVTKQLIDQAILIFYKSPNSFTGEDVLEINIHGSKAACNLTLDALSNITNLRFAVPGEFSMRSFANGKMDLTQLEGLVDLIDAETEAQHAQSLRQMSGELGKIYGGWRQDIIKILGLVEALIDFPEDEIPEDIIDKIRSNTVYLFNMINNHLRDSKKGEKLKEGAYATILGEPNVGKSSIINKIAKRDVAIVSDIKGTTRDIIEINLDVKGYPITIADTAGLRESLDSLENEGIKRSLERASIADLKIVVFDSSFSSKSTIDLVDSNSIVVLNKSDIASTAMVTSLERALKRKNPRKIIKVCALNSSGIGELMNEIYEFVKDFFAVTRENPLITRHRYRDNLNKASDHLKKSQLENDLVLVAEELRIAAHYIGRITGQIDVESILGEIFSNFCIGK